MKNLLYLYTVKQLKKNIMDLIYVKVQVKVVNGEYEYYQHSVHTLEVPNNTTIENTNSLVREFGENHAKTYYGNLTEDDNGTYYFNGGEVATKLYTVDVIPYEDYKVLVKHLV